MLRFVPPLYNTGLRVLRFSAILVLLSAYLTTVVLAFAQVVVRCTSVKYVKLDLGVTGEQHVYSANHRTRLYR